MYHENGVRSFRGEYFDGVGTGEWVYYNKDGTLILHPGEANKSLTQKVQETL